MTDEQLDRVYRDYFRREMPAELPPLRKSEVAAVPTGYSGRSRLTLAASIAALFVLGMWLSNAALPTKGPAKDGPTNLLKDAEADGSKLLPVKDDDGPMPELPMP